MLLTCVLIVLGTCALSPVLSRLLGRNAGWALALPLLGVAAALAVIGTSEQHVSWMPTLGIGFTLQLDGLSLLFSLLVLVIGAGVLAYSARYLGAGRHTGFYALMTAFAAAMLVLVLADDVVLLFVAWEMTTLCSFLLIGRTGSHARASAVRTLLVTAMGGLALLSAVAVMVVTTGTTRLSVILEHGMWGEGGAATVAVTILLAVAAFTKSAQFPFQAWLPDSMVAITPVSAYLHAAAMVKAGIYLLLRFSPALAGDTLWMSLLVTAGLITALLGAVSALKRTDLKELLAYSTISQLGLLVTMIGVGTEASLTAATAHTLAHALFKAALFMLVGVIDHRTGTRDVRTLAKLRVRMPATVTALAVAALSMAGLPPMLGFVSKEGMLAAFLEVPGPLWVSVVVTAAAAVASVFTFAYAFRMIIGARGGKEGPVVTEDNPFLWIVPALAAAAGLVLGLVPFILDGLVSGAATAAAGAGIDAHLALWHGINLPLTISLAVFAIGTVLVVARMPIDQYLKDRAFPFSALGVVDAIQARTIAIGGRIGAVTGTTSPRRHLAMAVLGVSTIAAVGVVVAPELPPILGESFRAIDLVLLLMVGTAAVAAMRANTRVAAIVVVSVVGFSMTLWFFLLGAADVALTQLLVEILTVVVMVLLLRRLPLDFSTPTRRRKVPAFAIAIAAGLSATVGVWALTGRRELSEAGEFYLTEGPDRTGGANIVNTILVDFRAMDTFGELAVLGIAGISIAVLVRSRLLAPARRVHIDASSPLQDPIENAVFTRTLARALRPAVIIASVLLLLRGHQEPGGGFISALVAGAGIALLYLAAPTDREARIRWPYIAFIGSGILIAVGAGLLGYLEGSFLTPLKVDVFGYSLTTALVFDVGVYMGVLGVIVTALNLLGLPRPHEKPVIDEEILVDPSHREEVST